LLLSVADLSIPSGVSITPWTPIGSALLGTSQGGVGSDPVTNSLEPGAGGNGGPINVTTSSGSSIAIANNANQGTVNGITALSVGNYGGINYNSNKGQAIWGSAGSGGNINVSHSGTIADSTSLTDPFNNSGNLIGLALASSGGSSVIPTPSSGTLIIMENQWSGVPPNSGDGGSITATLSPTGAISLQSGNAIGILALSQPGGGALPTLDCSKRQCTWTGPYFGSGGSVSVANQGTIANGNASSFFSAGILALSSGSNALVDPFGTNTVAVGSFGIGGAVNVSNTGSIAAPAASAWAWLASASAPQASPPTPAAASTPSAMAATTAGPPAAPAPAPPAP